MADGSTDSRTLSLGPHNWAKIPAAARLDNYANPGIVVDSVTDQGGSPASRYRLEIKLKNVSGK